MRRTFSAVALAVALCSCSWLVHAAPAGFAARESDGSARHGGPKLPFVESFETDPRGSRDVVAEGDPDARLTWERSQPAYPGDRAGSLTALYDSTLPPALFGFRLPGGLDDHAEFAAAATFVIDPDGFVADPNAFFQISWGLWSSEATGLNRTGNFTSFAADTFELLELDYFPNVSPSFGGPFLSPTMFGESVSPSQPDAFANASFAFGVQSALPFGVPLLAVISHEPAIDAVIVSVHRIVGPARTVPVPGAVTVIDPGQLASRRYSFDAVGLTLWQDGFGGPAPGLRAKVVFHSLIVQRGAAGDPSSMLKVRGR